MQYATSSVLNYSKRFNSNLESVDNSFPVLFHGIGRKFGACQVTHALQSKVTKICLAMLKKLSQLIARSYEKIRLAEN